MSTENNDPNMPADTNTIPNNQPVHLLFILGAVVLLALTIYRLRRFLLRRNRLALRHTHQQQQSPYTYPHNTLQGISTNQLNEVAPLKVYEGGKKGGEREVTCAICLEGVEKGAEGRELRCGHWFHGGCIEKWVGRKNRCPNCTRVVVGKEKGGEGGRESGDGSCEGGVCGRGEVDEEEEGLRVVRLEEGRVGTVEG